jgi:glycosyltransferase involved in cell wall biosynthesis
MIAPAIFWSSVLLVVYAYVGYPCALAALAVRRRRSVAKGSIPVRVSFIITAHNEARRIREKIENTLAQDYSASLFEVFVASDCSNDATDEVARSYGDRLRLVRTTERRGKEAAQQLAVEAASGDVLIFSDVGTSLAPDAVSTMVRNFADQTVGCVSSVDRMLGADAARSGEGAYVRYEMRLRMLETAVNSLVGLSGSFFAARREVCRAWASDRQSDFSTLLNAVDLGFRGVLDPDSVGYYHNIVDDRRESARKVRTVVRGIAVVAKNLRMLNPFRYGLFAWQLASHKICRWSVPFALIGAAVANALLARQSAFYAAVFAGQLLFYAAAVLGAWTGARALRMPAFLLLSNVAILTAWVRYAAGERITFWDPSDRPAGLPHASARTMACELRRG